jgi:hypothetical protein
VRADQTTDRVVWHGLRWEPARLVRFVPGRDMSGPTKYLIFELHR